MILLGIRRAPHVKLKKRKVSNICSEFFTIKNSHESVETPKSFKKTYFRQTRRERLKSALYLRLKKRNTFFSKKLEIFEKFF